MPKLSHQDARGRARMVEVGSKAVTARTAVAAGCVRMRPEVLRLVVRGGIPKGDVLAAARLAGIMGAKRTPEIIPLCHPLPLTGVEVSFQADEARGVLEITARASADARTGVEMEALTAVVTAALTVYDMCKAVQRDIEITDVRLLAKSGGKSGTFVRKT